MCQLLLMKHKLDFIPEKKIRDKIIMAHKLIKSYDRKHIYPRCIIKVNLRKAYDFTKWIFLHQILIH